MSRRIIDCTVEKHFEYKPTKLYYELLKEFPGEVIDSLTKINITKSKFGFSKISITDKLEKNMKELEPVEDECFIELNGRPYLVNKKEFILLKVLAIEQYSKCDDYSEVVSRIFLQLIAQVLQHKKVYEFEASTDYTDLKLLLHDLISGFVLRQLGQKQKSNEVYEDKEEEE